MVRLSSDARIDQRDVARLADLQCASIEANHQGGLRAIHSMARAHDKWPGRIKRSITNANAGIERCHAERNIV